MQIPSDVIAKVNDTFQKGFELTPERLRPESHLFTDLELDSLDMIDLLVHLEDHLGTKIPGERLREVQTLGDVYRLVFETSTAKQSSAAALPSASQETSQ